MNAKIQGKDVCFVSLVVGGSPGIEGGLDVKLSSSVSSISCSTFEYPVAAGATDAGSDMLPTCCGLEAYDVVRC